MLYDIYFKLTLQHNDPIWYIFALNFTCPVDSIITYIPDDTNPAFIMNCALTSDKLYVEAVPDHEFVSRLNTITSIELPSVHFHTMVILSGRAFSISKTHEILN